MLFDAFLLCWIILSVVYMWLAHRAISKSQEFNNFLLRRLEDRDRLVDRLEEMMDDMKEDFANGDGYKWM